jgi:hypothetical protein
MTQAVAPRRNDWTAIGAAVGAENGEAEFGPEVVALAHERSDDAQLSCNYTASVPRF